MSFAFDQTQRSIIDNTSKENNEDTAPITQGKES